MNDTYVYMLLVLAYYLFKSFLPNTFLFVLQNMTACVMVSVS